MGEAGFGRNEKGRAEARPGDVVLSPHGNSTVRSFSAVGKRGHRGSAQHPTGTLPTVGYGHNAQDGTAKPKSNS